MDVREKVREAICAEVARQNPVEDARRTLELIAETAIRFVEDDGGTTFHVIDDDGRPRTTLHDGESVSFTIRDLVAELREKHPSLFLPEVAEAPDAAKAGPPAESLPAVTAEPNPAALAGATGLPADPEPVEAAPPGAATVVADVPAAAVPASRDWLFLGANASVAERPARREPDPIMPTPASAAEPAAEPPLAVAQTEAPAGETLPEPAGRAEASPALPRTGLFPVPRGEDPPTAPQSTGGPAPSGRESGMPRRPRRSGTRAAAAAAAVLLLGTTGYLAFAPDGEPVGKPAPREQQQAQAAAPTRADPTSTGTVPAAVADPSPPPPAVSPPGPLHGVAEVIDTATLRIEGRVVRLFGVEWARGGRPDDLTSYLAGREVACEPADANEVYRCKVDGRDLSQVVLFNGGGRAAGDAPAELMAAQERARTERIGVWQK